MPQAMDGNITLAASAYRGSRLVDHWARIFCCDSISACVAPCLVCFDESAARYNTSSAWLYSASAILSFRDAAFSCAADASSREIISASAARYHPRISSSGIILMRRVLGQIKPCSAIISASRGFGGRGFLNRLLKYFESQRGSLKKARGDRTRATFLASARSSGCPGMR